MSIFICPVCAEKLSKSGNSYLCSKGHCFDKAKSGYVNLLLSRNSGKGVHGDNKLMLRARRDFLEKGYYEPLCAKISEAAAKYAENDSVILDAGCGEGYYTFAIKEKFDRSDIAVEMYGIDISKDAVDLASRRSSDISCAVASVFHIPVMSGACSILLTMFAPYCGEEYHRVLKNDGIMIMAIPSEDHLWELKKAVYDTPYKNEVKLYELERFSLLEKERVTFSMNIGSKADIRSLFSMTPYCYRTGKTERERLDSLESLETQADFEILIYRKE